MTTILAPAPLSAVHELDEFESGEPSLDFWLKETALKNQGTGSSRSFVVCDQHSKVIGYYSLSSGAINRGDAPKSMQRNMPSPLPIILLGRLAVDLDYQNQGLGRGMLRDAVMRIVHASQDVGIFAILIHAISESAKRFYLSCGFVQSPLQPMTLMMTVKTARSILLQEN